MKKIYLIIWIVYSFQSVYSQEITNFYLEPGSTNDEVILNTSFYYYNVAGYIESSYTMDGNIINFSICYALYASTSPTYEDRQFIVSLPSGFPNFILNVDLFFYDPYTDECNYENSEDSGVFEFEVPYSPTATTFVPDDTFEAYFELNGFGDDILDNDSVFTHKIINLSILNLDYSNISALGPRIEDLTGIENLYRLKDLKLDDNEIVEFDGTNHPQLEYLSVYNDQLESVDLSQNPNLWWLEIESENLIALDLTANTNLKNLIVSGVPNISQLDVSNLLNIRFLGIFRTGVTDIDLTNNLLLTYFSCVNNPSLTILTFGNAPNLTQANCYDNALEVLDISEFSSLIELNASGNNLSYLDVRRNLNIESIHVSDNDLTSINLRNGFSQNITYLNAMDNPDLYCVEVDDANAAPYGNYWIYNYSQPILYSDNCALGINDSEQLQTVVYPNPVRDILNISSQENIESIHVYTLNGQLLASENYKSKIDFSTYTNGIYFLKINTEKGSVFHMVMKK